MLLLKNAGLIATGAVLAIGKEEEREYVQVVKGEASRVAVAPAPRGSFGEGTPVEQEGISAPFALLMESVQEGATQLVVIAMQEVQPEDILMIDDPNNREFVRVREVQPRVALPGEIPFSTGSIFPGEPTLSAGVSTSTLPFLMAFEIVITEPLRFNHVVNQEVTGAARTFPVVLRRVSSYFLGIADGERVDFQDGDAQKAFFPFGEQPGPGDVFYFGTTTGFPQPIEIRVDLHMTSPNIELLWELYGANGWEAFQPELDETEDLIKSGRIVFPRRSFVATEVNGQSDFWLRSQPIQGNYGLPVGFEQVDPDDASAGFRIKPGTGNLFPPVVTKLSLSYHSEHRPVVLAQNGFLYSDYTARNAEEGGFAPFVALHDLEPPIYADPEPAFYLGFDGAFPEQPVRIYIAIEPRAFSGSVVKETRTAPAPSSALPPLRWEYFDGLTWTALTVFDGTNHLTESGGIVFLTPADIAPLAKFDLIERYWVRARSSANDPYNTQDLSGVYINTISALQAATVNDEVVGSSTGQPGQVVRLAQTPVLSGRQVMVREAEPPSGEERQALEEEEGSDAVQERRNPATGETEFWVRWHEIANLLQSEPYSRHYTLDPIAGLVSFGDGKRGLIPPRGTNNIIATYRTGGGPNGNVSRAVVSQIKAPPPGVASVTNALAADGGAAIETLPMVRDRGPQTLRHRDRAITAADLEWLARQASGTRVARAKSLANVNRDLFFEPGWATLLIVPRGTEAKLSPGPELIREVESYLESRAFVGLARSIPPRISVMGPGYIQVAVSADVVPLDIDEVQEVKQRVLAALAAFFHPLTGGPGGTGWEFGRDVYASEVCQVIEGLEGVSYVGSLQLTANSARHHLSFTSAPTALLDFPEGAAVITTNLRKAALLAEPVGIGIPLERVAVKGFKEGDRIARVLDVQVSAISGNILGVTAPDGTPIPNDMASFPKGSLVMAFDGSRRTRLAEGILPGPPGEGPAIDRIMVEDPTLAAVGDLLTVFYPFPMTITTVTIAEAGSRQVLGIEPYTAEMVFPAGGVVATLDNRIRMPLATGISVGEATCLELTDFSVNDQCLIARRDGAIAPLNLAIRNVAPVFDIVYLDDNFLVYPGTHTIEMVATDTPFAGALPFRKQFNPDEPPS